MYRDHKNKICVLKKVDKCKQDKLTLICSSYFMERPLSQSNPNLMRCITNTLGRALMQVRFTVVLLKNKPKFQLNTYFGLLLIYRNFVTLLL